MKVVTICGSMRFQNEMPKIARELAVKGFCVIQPIYDDGGTKGFSEQEYQNIVAEHFKKIDLSDAIYVVNIDGYVGESVRNEIAYARQHGKQVIFHVE